jgi:hypothetical protein
MITANIKVGSKAQRAPAIPITRAIPEREIKNKVNSK